jgi:hypothetical protein
MLKGWNKMHWARLAIAVQFLALIRTLAEYFRVKVSAGNTASVEQVDPLVLGALIAAILTGLATGAYMTAMFRWAIALAVLTVAALVMVKLGLST